MERLEVARGLSPGPELEKLDLNGTTLGKRFLQTTRKFYRMEASAWRETTASSYKQHLQIRIAEEKESCPNLLFRKL